jgi:hypothetical protein
MKSGNMTKRDGTAVTWSARLNINSVPCQLPFERGYMAKKTGMTSIVATTPATMRKALMISVRTPYPFSQ